MLQGAQPDLLANPINVIKVSLHPRGVASRIANFPQWRRHIVSRLQQQLELTGDAYLESLLDEVVGYPLPEGAAEQDLEHEHLGVLLPLKLRTATGVLSFISTVTVFGTPHDITLQELAIESFFPADEYTASELRPGFSVRRARSSATVSTCSVKGIRLKAARFCSRSLPRDVRCFVSSRNDSRPQLT